MDGMRAWGLLLAGAIAWSCGDLAAAPAAGIGVPAQPRFRLLGVPDGLPHTTVTGLARDRAGYLWIATNDGLARHDGVGFRTWRHVPGDPRSLRRNVIEALHVDARDRLWIATEGGGLSMLDARREGFRHFTRGTDPRIGSDDVWAVASQGDAVWFGTYAGGLHRLDATPGEDWPLARYTHDAGDPRSLPSNTVLAVAFDAAGAAWVGTTSGLARFDGDGFERIALPGPDAAPMVYSLTAVGADIWVGTAGGVFVVSRGADGAVRIRSPRWSSRFAHPNAMVSLARDRDGWWVGSQRRLWRIDDADGVPVALPLGPDIGRPVRALLLQRDGALWTPVAGRGLGYLRSDWRRIAQLGRDDGLQGDLYEGLATATSGGFWAVGRPGALARIGPEGRVAAVAAAMRDALAGLRLRAVAEDGRGGLWLAAARTLLHVDAAGAVRRWTPASDRDATQDGLIDHLAPSPDGRFLWVAATGSGLQQRDLRSGAIVRDLRIAGHPALAQGDVDAIRFAPDGTPWFAGDGGLLRFDERDADLHRVASLAGGRVHGFDFAPDGSLWLHRLTGLEHHVRTGSRWRLRTRIADTDGIPAVESGGLRVDRAGRPWLATPRGLFHWDPRARQVRRFGVAHGLSTQEFVARTLVIDGRGVLAAALADGGVVLLDTTREAAGGPAPALRLDTLAVRRGGGWQPLSPDRVVVAPDDVELRVDARLLAFDDPALRAYWSWLEGVDPGWVAQGADGTRVFAGLPDGLHRLRVRARDGHGRAAAERVLDVRVLPPWWRTWWALALWTAASAATLAAVAVAYRAALARREALRMARHARTVAIEASEAKSRFLATFGHEVRTPMTGVLGMSELLLGDRLDTVQRRRAEAIHAAGRHLLQLVDDALDLARLEAGRLPLASEPFGVHALVDEVAALFAPLAARRGLAWSCAMDADVPDAVVGDARRVRQVLLNLVGNAVKFTGDGEVALRIFASQEGPSPLLAFEVRDTGPGLDDAQQARLFRRFEQAEGARTATRFGGSGLGLAICQELAEAMGGRIAVASAPGRGSRFTLYVPLRTA